MTQCACRWNKFFFGSGIFLILLLGPWLRAFADEDLLDYVQLKQMQARALLDNCEIRYSTSIQHVREENALQNSEVIHGDIVEYRQDGRRRFEAAYDLEYDKNFGEPTARMGNYATTSAEFISLNENEVAYWARRDGERVSDMQIWRHTSVEDVNGTAASRIDSNRTVDIIDYAFGLVYRVGTDPPGDMRSIREVFSKFGSFEAERVGSGESEVIQIVHKRDGKTWMTATVDPNKGFATTKLEFTTAPDGGEYGQFFQSHIEVEEIANGIWAPISVEATGLTNREARRIENSVSVVVRSVIPDQTFDPELFQWTSLNYPGSKVHLTDEAGIKTLMMKADSRLRPHPLSSESRLTPEAIAAEIAELLEENPDVAPELMEAPSLAPISPSTLDAKPASPWLPIGIIATLVILGGLGIVVVRRA